jgi:bacterioferritin (cytochrome b1)
MTRTVAFLAHMQNFERLSVQIYRMHIPAFKEQRIIDRLKSALINEQEHVDNLGKRLAELEGTPSPLGIPFQVAGWLLGLFISIMGKSFILRSDIWIEKQAIKGYERFLERAKPDSASGSIALNNIEDEKNHIDKLWNSLIDLKGSENV